MRNILCKTTTLILLLCIAVASQAQIVSGQDTLVGNEWIDYSRPYYKIKIAEDGYYRLNYTDMLSAGIPVDGLQGKELLLYHFGEEVSIRTSTEGTLGPSDYIEFVGEQNRGQLDQYLYRESDDQLNPMYSMYTDTSAYFLTWDITQSGKRYEVTDTDLSGNTLGPEPFYIHSDVNVFSNAHNKPTEPQNVRFSQYLDGEGYCSPVRATNTSSHTTSHIYEEGPDPSVRVRVSGNNIEHLIDVSVDDNIIITATYSKATTHEFASTFDRNILDNNPVVKVRSYQSTEDKNTIAVSTISYARSFDFDGQSYFTFDMEASANERYLEISNFNIDGGEVYLIDAQHGSMYRPELEDGIAKVIIPSTTVPTRYILVNIDEAVKPVTELQPAHMTDYSKVDDAEFIIITSQLLDKPHTDGINYVRAYADHRASDNGGAMISQVVLVEDLYDQYAYGVNFHPLSIKNFGRWMEQNWQSQKYYFIIGKAVEYISTRTAEQILDPNPVILHNIVPTFGLPGSDNTLLSKKNHSQPRVPTGRIAANDTEDLKNYYDKIVLREDPNNYPQTIEGKLWTKKILHLAGGDPNIQEIIRNSLTNMGNILVQSRFGAEVEQIEKRSSDNIQTPLTTKILNSINNGVSILSFFGHSSAGTFDFSIEKASEYENMGRLPIILSMGCYSGNIHSNGEALSEDFVLEKDVGAIAFLAAAGSAFIAPQGDLGQQMYEKLSTEYYGLPLGDLVQSLLEKNDTLSNSNYSLRSLNEQFTLHGDPALIIRTHEGPDYVIDYTSVRTDPMIIAPENKTFDLIYKVSNLGEGIYDSINVRAIHYLPDGTVYDTIYGRIAAPLHEVTDTLLLSNPEVQGVGKNCVTIEVDYDNQLNELPSPIAEQNNLLGYNEGQSQFCFFILDNSANPIYPERYAIVNNSEPSLIAASSNILGNANNYKMELDTTALFNSNLKMTKNFIDHDDILEWEPDITYQPGEVYYWRVSADSTNADIGYQWKQSSFIYLPNSSNGWNQSHYYQFLGNNLTGIDYEDRKLDFIDQGISVFANLRIPDYNSESYPRFYEDTFTPGRLQIWTFSQDGIGVSVRDNDINVFQNNAPPGQYGSISNNSTRRIFFFPTADQQSRIDLVNFLEDIVEEGYHVFVYTVTNSIESDLHIDEWALDSLANNGRNIFNTLEKQGATKVRQLEGTGTVPYGMVYTKNEHIRDENIAAERTDIITIGSDFTRNYVEGDLNTPNIGPALSWDKVLWKVEDVELTDTFMLYIKGLKANGDMDTLYTIINETEIDISSVDAEVYPYLRLDMYTYDDVERSPVNVDYWRVLYESTPEAILVKDDSFIFEADTLDQGQQMRFAIKAENITSTDMDSLLVRYVITDENNNEYTQLIKSAPLLGNEQMLLQYTYSTEQLSGDHQFNFEINPNGDQPEKFTFNNFGVREFYVRRDDKDPVMDVTFDGVHIINGDLVSAEPYILIEVRDENEYLLLDDPEDFQIALISPNGNRVDYTAADPEITFVPAETGSNIAKMSLEPNLDMDGTYQLIVQSRDASGNFSGVNSYDIEFEVIREQSVSQVLNYPNPFSTQTQFIFTLTGSEIPDQISITILTVSGKVVKEISGTDLGPLRIGLNKTSYRWDGTDDFGEPLANGVYLYKVNLPTDMKRYETQADSYFEKGFGKMVILR